MSSKFSVYKTWKDRAADRRLYDNKKEILRENISDCLGNPLDIGTVVAYSAGSRLNFAVYEGINKSIMYGDSHYTYKIQIRRCTDKIKKQSIGQIYITDDGFTNPDNVIAVENPLYCLSNAEIGKCLAVIDKLKDEGILPKDFKP